MSSMNGIVDLSHYNDNVNLASARQAGIAGIIHKATQGWQYCDPMYDPNRKKALDAGLLWGAYHFGTGADGVLQANYFLQTVNPDSQTLLVLDFEANPQGPSMSLDEARVFVTHVETKTGRWPGLYGGAYLKHLLGAGKDPILANCWLWLSQYGPTPVVPANWPTWTMWQYTDGVAGPPPHEVPGIGRCDRDIFHGTETDLRAFWTNSIFAQAAEEDISFPSLNSYNPAMIAQTASELMTLVRYPNEV